jgi:uncharacterized protein DUF1015
VAEELAFVRGEEQRPAIELAQTAGVVQECGPDEKVAPQSRVELNRVPAQGRHRDGVLEEPAGIGVMRVRCGRQNTETRAKVGVSDEPAHELVEPRMRDLGGQELEEAVQLLEVSARLGHECRGICLGRLEGAHFELEAVAEPLHAPEDAHGVAFSEALVEEVDVAPDARVDPSTRIDELEREVGAPATRAQALLTGDRVGALDDPVLSELRYRHGPILGPPSAASLARMALVKPFRALRYAAGAAGPLDELVSPPYDVISAALHDELLARNPYNAVRLVRPDDPEEAARLLKAWQADGTLVREAEPAVWLSEEEFTGPNKEHSTRRGLIARVALEPYHRGIVLPHERSFPKPRRGRLRLLRATCTKLSPILLLHEGPGPDVQPSGPPDLEATLDGVTTRLWRLDSAAAEVVRPPLVIADGHHRYEAALRFHEEEGSEETAHVLAALVSASDPGLVILPTHRVAASAPEDLPGRNGLVDLRKALEDFAGLPRDRAGFVLVRREGATVVESGGAALDTALVDELPLEGVRYTANAEEAEAAVASGAAEAAFIVRPPTIEQVKEFARAGELMPQKSTYFYPKLASGLLFSPFDE